MEENKAEEKRLAVHISEVENSFSKLSRFYYIITFIFLTKRSSIFPISQDLNVVAQ